MEDLIEHPNFESEFSNLAKGIPDLERIVSRIHAKSCKVKDFLKVLSVSRPVLLSQQWYDQASALLQSFKKLSKGVESLLDEAENFKSKGVASLLRSAPDVRQNIKHIEDMFKRPEKGSVLSATKLYQCRSDVN